MVFLFELIVFGLTLLFGRYLGYTRAFTVCFWIGIVIGASFISIFLLNLLELLLRSLFHFWRKLRHIHGALSIRRPLTLQTGFYYVVAITK